MALPSDHSILMTQPSSLDNLSKPGLLSQFSNEQSSTYPIPAGSRRIRSRCTFNNVSSLLVVYSCCALGITTVADYRFASWLGQTSQLVMIGIVLYLMAGVMFKDAQKVLLIYEARFGRSLLHNYDGKPWGFSAQGGNPDLDFTDKVPSNSS